MQWPYLVIKENYQWSKDLEKPLSYAIILFFPLYESDWEYLWIKTKKNLIRLHRPLVLTWEFDRRTNIDILL